MREIKFRAWNKQQKIMHQIFDSTNHTEWYLPNVDDRFEIMQYTGLKDKNDTEIYEGDIYKVTFGKHFLVYEVKSIGGQFGNTLFGILLYDNLSVDEDDEMYTYQISKDNVGNRSYIASGKDCEVIGNIYEDGGLLNGE